jgi:hypothetical protein
MCFTSLARDNVPGFNAPDSTIVAGKGRLRSDGFGFYHC